MAHTIRTAASKALTLAKRTLRLLKALATDKRLPRPVRWGIMVGFLPIPGPFEYLGWVLALALLTTIYRNTFATIRAETR